MKWKRLQTTVLLDHPRITVYEDTVELPNGRQTEYLHFGAGNDSGMILAMNDQGQFLVQQEYSYPPNEILYQPPGGGLNKDESPIEGARREFTEETGLQGILHPLGWFYTNNRRSSAKMYVFLATNIHKIHGFKKDEEELFEETWLTEQEITQFIASGTIRNYSFLAGWSLYQAYKNQVS